MPNQGQQDSKVLSPRALAHVVLRTSNFKPMVAFYKAFLGAHATFENEFLSFLTYDGEHHRIAIGNVSGTSEQAPTSAGLEHLAFPFIICKIFFQRIHSGKLEESSLSGL
ncbi:unnamed protein product [Clonostachys chloroleuca]|uniref:VOC domain-containing protein n=1 Tax=Clonostachys chloroleuca TaxID=1926264 RepID=A0AA35QBW4_9HYPO|nr:unnamed protein product [Clonostachys chloroleuca]